MPENYGRVLQFQLRQESHKLSEKFATLAIDAEGCLIRKNVSVDMLKSSISPSRDDTLMLPADDVDKATNISEMFIILKNKGCLTFINYTMMFRIIHLCDSKKLLKKLKKYETDFKKYIKRRVSDIALYEHGEFKLGKRIHPAKGAELLIITDDSWSSEKPFQAIENLKVTVSKIFNIIDFALSLQRIETNCLRLHYYISTSVGKRTFPLSSEQLNQLKSCKISEIHYQESHYYFFTQRKLQ